MLDISNINGYTLKNLNRINIILGKNGAGKSKMFREIENGLASQSDTYGTSRYITPERGGNLEYSANVDVNISNNIRWLYDDRRRNQSDSFRQQSVSQFAKLELLVLREFEQDQTNSTFEPYVKKINSLLDNIEIIRVGRAFKIYSKSSKQELSPSQISSGESELISLCIECLIFGKECIPHKVNILFLDEPDVHLHPDLQERLMRFLTDMIIENNSNIIVATHSTSILGALHSYSDTHLAFMTFNQKEINFDVISDIYKKVLPVFGAHPLSNIFNEAPIWLVEGEDDERVWQQAVRSSRGKIRLYPCSVDGIDNMSFFEQETQKIILTVYDNAIGYSLRDRDGGKEEIDDILPVKRMRLSCRNCENLLLSDEVLKSLNISWEELKRLIDDWLMVNQNHSHYSEM